MTMPGQPPLDEEHLKKLAREFVSYSPDRDPVDARAVEVVAEALWQAFGWTTSGTNSEAWDAKAREVTLRAAREAIAALDAFRAGEGAGPRLTAAQAKIAHDALAFSLLERPNTRTETNYKVLDALAAVEGAGESRRGGGDKSPNRPEVQIRADAPSPPDPPDDFFSGMFEPVPDPPEPKWAVPYAAVEAFCEGQGRNEEVDVCLAAAFAAVAPQLTREEAEAMYQLTKPLPEFCTRDERYNAGRVKLRRLAERDE